MEKRYKKSAIDSVFFHFFCVLLFLLFFVPGLYSPSVLSAGSDIPYTVSITGIKDQELQAFLEGISRTITLRENPPATISLLERRIEQDIPRMLSGLRSRGYYSARVDYEVNTDSRPVKVLLKVRPGPVFVLESVDVRIEGDAGSLKRELLENKKISALSGSPVNSEKIIETQDFIEHWFRNRGFPFASLDKPRMVVDHARQAASLTYIVKPGPRAFFGNVTIKGLETVKESFVRRRIPWKKGEPFDAALLNEARQELSDTGLFVSVDVEESGTIDKKGNLPVYIRLRERDHRTIKAGVSYMTDEGPGGRVSWENRNMFGEGERLHVSGILSDITYSAEGAFHKPVFLRQDQALRLNMRLAEESPDAFTSRSLTSSIKVERALTKQNTLGAGIGFGKSEIRQFGREDRFTLFSLPLAFDRDTKNDLLDPSAGGHLNIQVSPYRETFGTDLTFFKGQAGYSRYFRLSNRLVLAAKANAGAIEGADLYSVPADIRFYAGGGGSVRGYAYQLAGPLIDGVPTGGRSLFTLSTELRTRVSDTIGLVFFVDGGSVFHSALPDFSEDLLWGAGAGFRYFTAIGPLRLDVGIPLNRREGIDDPFQIYVSLGQAF